MIEITPVHGLPEVQPGDDLARLIADKTTLRDGDVVVVTSKIVSKAEGRIVEVDPLDREAERARLAASGSRRIVASRGPLVITETLHGFVCANAGIDGSNLAPDRLALLPADPDGSASALRAALVARTGASVGIVISDTFGRAWRMGQVNVAIGVAGMPAMRDHRGEKDGFGNVLEVTLIAEADEIASAAELVMGKTDDVPVAIVRGLGASGEGDAKPLLRPAYEDLFRYGTVEAIEARRTVRAFSSREVPREAIERAVEAAATAPAPHHSRPWRFVFLASQIARQRFLDAMRIAWRADLEGDGTTVEVIEELLAHSDALLAQAPALLACFVSTESADAYSDERRRIAERDMFVASAGAAVQNLMLALSAYGVGSCWVSASIFCSEIAATSLDLEGTWQAVGCVAAGYPASEVPLRSSTDLHGILDVR